MDFKNENIWLMQGDCLERMKEIPDGSVDMVLCDPPYGTVKCRWDSVVDLNLMWAQLKRVIKPSGAIVITASQPFTSTLIMSCPDLYKYSWTWIKNRCGNFMAAKYKPLKYTEDIVVFGFGAVNTKGGRGGGKTKRPYLEYNPVGFTEDKSIVVRNTPLPTYGINRWNKLSNVEFKSNGKDYPKDFIIFDMPPNKERIHPTQKPVELMEYMVKTYTNEGETVLDFTMGSGATIKACNNLNRKAIGIEMGHCEKKGHKYEGMEWTDVLIDQLELKEIT